MGLDFGGMTENVYIWRQNGFEHMAKFERWKHAWAHTGPFRVYKQYYLELNQYYWAAYSGHKITYTEMAKKGYTWEKTKRLDRQVIDDAIEGIAKGTWAQRRSAFDSLFGGHPVECTPTHRWWSRVMTTCGVSTPWRPCWRSRSG